jgi:hypothetical protein
MIVATQIYFLMFTYFMQLRKENKLTKSSVMVTAGANQVRLMFHLDWPRMFFVLPILPCKVVKLQVVFPSFWSLALWGTLFSMSFTSLVKPDLFLLLFFQAFVNLVLTLCDAGDSVVMFMPYYFNAYMSFQMTGVTDILVGACDPKTLHPDVGKMTLLFFLCI